MRKLTLILLAVAASALLVGCNKAVDTIPVTEGMKGFSFSASSFDTAGVADFFAKLDGAAQIVSWQGDWQQLTESGGAPYLVLNSAETHNYLPVIVVHAYNNETGKPIHTLDAATRKSYIDSIAKVAKDYSPVYIGIGIEVNSINEQSPNDFNDFVSLFNDATDAIKAASPTTKVFTTFQLERMKGLNGGLFGGVNDASKAEWSLLDKFAKADLFAFTTYPGIIYDSPYDIPADYFTDISKHTSKAFAISESGWFRDAPAGWDGSDAQEQADFVTHMFSILPNPRPLFVIWSFLYDPPIDQPIFKTTGLLKVGQSTSPAYEAWIAAK